MTNAEIQIALINILKKEYQETHRAEYKGPITPLTRLSAFTIDSLDEVETVMLLERAFNIEIYDEVIESKFRNDSTINDMTLAIASLRPRRTTDWYNTEFPDKTVKPHISILNNKLTNQK